MRNLKRILSLAMASVMLVGMMVVGASAADFPDSDKIKNVDAVDTMVSLNIINGKEDGNFDPEGIVTRAEMAKMICVALNGGKDPNLGTSGGIYPDTKGNWAAGYIDFCANRGIVSGDDKGNFNPSNTVTGTEAAKMILIALGYNAETEGFVNNAKWDININVLASTVGLYDNVAINSSEGLTRDNAAQMLYDGMQATMVKYEMVGIINGNGVSQAVPVDPKDGKDTILKSKFDMVTAYGYMTGVKYDSKKDVYTYTITDKAAMGSDKIDQDTGVTLPNTIKSSKDFSALYGQQVKVFFKDDSDKTVYGIAANDSTVLVSSIGGKLPSTVKASDTSVKIDGTTYDLTGTAADIPVYNFNDTVNSPKTLDAQARKDIAAYAIALIDNDGDEEGDVLVVYPVIVAKVTFVGKDSITAGNISYKFDDCNIYDDVAKDDWVVITAEKNTAKGVATVVEAEVVSGTVDATRSGEVKLDGTWYTDASAKGGDSYSIGDEFELTVVNGYVYNAKAITSTTNVDNAVYVLQADDPGTGTKAGTQTVKLLFADGSTKVVNVDKVDAKVPGTLADVEEDKSNMVSANQLYTYATDKDGNYELTRIKSKDFDSKLEADGSTNGIKVDDGKATVANKNTNRFADDAVIFVVANNETKVISGKTVNSWKTAYTTSKDASVTTANAQKDQNILYSDKSNGFLYAKLGVLVLNVDKVPGANGEKAYGWVTDTSSLVKDGDDYYISMTIWNGEDEVTVLAESTKANSSIDSNTKVGDDANVKKGTPISFDDLGDGKIENVTSVKDKADAVTGYNDGKAIVFETAGDAEIDDDTVILYVDTANNDGVVGGSVGVAQEDALGNYVKNVYADVDVDGNVLFIIVDTTNNLDENESADIVADGTVFTAIDVDEGTATVANGKTVAEVITAAKAMDGVADADVVKSANDNAASTTLASGNILRITSTDGTFYSFTITVASAD